MDEPPFGRDRPSWRLILLVLVLSIIVVAVAIYTWPLFDRGHVPYPSGRAVIEAVP